MAVEQLVVAGRLVAVEQLAVAGLPAAAEQLAGVEQLAVQT